MIAPAQSRNIQVKPRWQAPVGVMESVVAYNCRKYGMPRPAMAMPMWEGAGNRAIDLSGHGNHGAINGADWVADGLSFVAAANDNLNCGNSKSLDITNKITIIASIKSPNTNANYQAFISKDTSPADGYLFRFSGVTRKLNLRLEGLTVESPVADTALSNNVKYQVAGTYDGAFINIYLDGIKDMSPVASTGTINSNNLNLLIGKRTDAYNYSGDVYYVYIYNTALTAAQIKFLYDDPYFMFRVPEELYGYVAAAAGVTIPVFLHHYNQMRQ